VKMAASALPLLRLLPSWVARFRSSASDGRHFIEHGKVDDLRAKYGLTVDEAQTHVMPLLIRRQTSHVVAS